VGRDHDAVGGGRDGAEVIRSDEVLHVGRRERPFGSARVTKTIVSRPVTEEVELLADHLVLDEVLVEDGAADSGEVETTPEGDLSVPVLAERLVLRTETYVAKRLVLRRTRVPHRREAVRETLRAERVVVRADRAPTPQDRARARRSGGEDLSRGPTPETRHPDGVPDHVRDTTQGPTPEIRRAFRAEGATAAAGEPGLDPATRADVGAGQDWVEPEVVHEVTTLEPGDPTVVRENETIDQEASCSR
jgi:hypothetical protein